MKFVAALCLLFASCTSAALVAQNDSDSTKLRHLAIAMTGSFSSEEQAAYDSSYYSINLEMHEIWKGDTDTIWLYVEQALSSKLEKPYRTRIYRLTMFDEEYESAVFRLPEEEKYYGNWEDEALFATLPIDSLLEREGCAVYLSKRKADNSYVGSTVEKECESNLRGASYATSEVEVFFDQITSWDRGWNEEDEYVWGAEHAPYVFKKKRQMQKRPRYSIKRKD